ncbi:hypothetical protein K4F52_001653 [Lecanicillium sp. MT-2017a]|nr:hypothetical protein K4F52_001653 [Lecanicillium sp. MT-2017a]
MKVSTISAVVVSLLSNVASAQNLPTSVTLHPVNGKPIELEFNNENKYRVTVDTKEDIETVDLHPNADAFKRCYFGSRESAALGLETAEDGTQRYRVSPPARLELIDCNDGCVPLGGRCFDPTKDASYVCCEGYCGGSGICS